MVQVRGTYTGLNVIQHKENLIWNTEIVTST